MSITEKLTARRTYKVIGDIDAPVGIKQKDNTPIDGLLAACANAPFHYACDRIHKASMPSSVPWRAYKLDGTACNALMQKLMQDGDKTKVPNMLWAIIRLRHRAQGGDVDQLRIFCARRIVQ